MWFWCRSQKAHSHIELFTVRNRGQFGEGIKLAKGRGSLTLGLLITQLHRITQLRGEKALHCSACSGGTGGPCCLLVALDGCFYLAPSITDMLNSFLKPQSHVSFLCRRR